MEIIIGSAVRNYYPTQSNIAQRSSRVSDEDKKKALAKTYYCSKVRGKVSKDFCKRRKQFIKSQTYKNGYNKRQSLDIRSTCGECKVEVVA